MNDNLEKLLRQYNERFGEALPSFFEEVQGKIGRHFSSGWNRRSRRTSRLGENRNWNYGPEGRIQFHQCAVGPALRRHVGKRNPGQGGGRSCGRARRQLRVDPPR